MKKKLFVFTNESIFLQNEKFFCDNIDLKSTPESLNKKFEVNLFGRKSNKKRAHEIKLKKIKIFSNIFSYLSEAIKSTKNKNTKFLIISISPYTFFICLFLRLYGKTPIVYLRSDGYGEYKAILGNFGKLIYHLMFNLVTLFSNLISCRKFILRGKKGRVVYPSQLDSIWLRKPKNQEVKNFKLLYVGRIRVEKGIFFLANLIKNKRDISLTIVGAEKNTSYKINQSNINIQFTQSNKARLIKYYDDHDIFILPSFTEGHPQVLDEALARLRPVIVFEEISHVKRDRSGVFICKRDKFSLIEKINYILKNYESIQHEIKKNINNLPTRAKFIKELENIIF